jgi:2-polyprenyl-6-methoxyphenol hydroxylase-like FAD-dependent oxidoreductase
MCALLLGRRGLPILLLEQRSDFRKVAQNVSHLLHFISFRTNERTNERLCN